MLSNPIQEKNYCATNYSPWTRTDTNWCLSIFGAAVGAGILFLPINAGIGGIWPLIALTILLTPLTLITHRSILRFCLAARDPASNFSNAADEHLGKTGSFWVTLAYFAFIFPIIMAYSIGLTNTVESMLVNQLNWGAPSRWLLSLVLMASLVGIVVCGEKIILKVVAMLVYPLGAILVAISLYQIPHWNLSLMTQPVTLTGFTKGFLSTLPILIFALAYVPVCSALAQSYRAKISDPAMLRAKTEQITFRGTWLLMVLTLLFTFSCLLSIPPEALLQAKQDNISVMTVLSLQSNNPVFSAITSIVGITAISSSFLGYYPGAREGLHGLMNRAFVKAGKTAPQKKRMNRYINTFYVLVLWLVGYLNLGVIDIMGTVAAPLMAVILYLMPVYAVRKTKALQPYRSKVDFLTATIGIICIVSYVAAAAM